MQNQRILWTALAAAGLVILFLTMITLSVSDQSGLTPGSGTSADGAPGELASRAARDGSGSNQPGPRGSETASTATTEERRLAIKPRPVALNASAAALLQAVEPRLRDFQQTSRISDWPDERGVDDREFLKAEELEEVEESLDLAELEQELFGAERTAVMYDRLNAALEGR